jgi:hypothetical protein
MDICLLDVFINESLSEYSLTLPERLILAN